MEAEEVAVVVEAEAGVVVTLKTRAMAATAYTCWAAVVRSSPSMEIDAPIPASVPLCDGNDYTVVRQQGSAGLSKSVSVRMHLRSSLPHSPVMPHHWLGVRYHSPSVVVVCTGPSTIMD